MVISTNHEVCIYVVGCRNSKTVCRSKRALVRNHVRRLERSGASVIQQSTSVCLRKQRTNVSGSIILKTLGKPHHNLQKVWSTLKLDELPSFVLVADLKVINFATVISTHASQQPCAYCFSSRPLWENSPLRSIATNQMLHNLWQDVSNDKSKLKPFYDCVNLPLFLSSVHVLLLCPPPTLHLKLGVSNPGFHELNEKFGVPYTSKVHVVLQHLEEFVALTARPFGAYSEQVVETQHHYYECHYSRFLVNPLNHELYK